MQYFPPALENLVEQFARLPGVGEVQMFGARDYSMRIWLRRMECIRHRTVISLFRRAV